METLLLPLTRGNGSKTMDGRYPADRILRQKVAEWVRLVSPANQEALVSKPATVHLDELLGAPVALDSLFAVSFRAYQILIEGWNSMGVPETTMPILRVPLECTEGLPSGPVSLEELLPQIDRHEPPSFYLLARLERERLRAMEQYVFPLDLTGDLNGTRLDADIYIYYNVTRSLEDIRNGWEYNRSVMAEYYPKQYRPSSE